MVQTFTISYQNERGSIEEGQFLEDLMGGGSKGNSPNLLSDPSLFRRSICRIILYQDGKAGSSIIKYLQAPRRAICCFSIHLGWVGRRCLGFIWSKQANWRTLIIVFQSDHGSLVCGGGELIWEEAMPVLSAGAKCEACLEGGIRDSFLSAIISLPWEKFLQGEVRIRWAGSLDLVAYLGWLCRCLDTQYPGNRTG